MSYDEIKLNGFKMACTDCGKPAIKAAILRDSPEGKIIEIKACVCEEHE